MSEEELSRTEVPEAIPDARAGARKWRWVLLIWIVPIVAVLMGAWLAVRGILNQGPTVVISFKTATGLEPGKTKVRYKDVEVGTVKSIDLSEDRSKVLVEAELTRGAKALIGDDTSFWVVRPRITGGQAFGLGTLLSGAYIALDPGKTHSSRRSFEGLENPLVVTADAPGRQFVLHADTLGSLDVGSPVYYRRVRVGQTVSAELDPDGKGVRFIVFVNAPYDRYVTGSTRFWNASGIDFSADSSGFRLETQSLASVVIGGIAFQSPPDAVATPAALANAEFQLFHDRDAAFKQPATVKDVYVLHFRQSVRGLNVGSPVDFRGVPIGEVTRVSLDFNRAQAELRPEVEIAIYPERIAARFARPQPVADPGVRAATLQRFVDRGMRAQLKTGNLVTGQVFITLDFFPKAERVRVAASTPLEIPTVPGGFEEIQTAAMNVLQKLEKVPLDEVAGDVRTTMAQMRTALNDLSTLVTSVNSDIAPELKQTLEQARETLGKAQAAFSDDAPLQGDLRGTLREVSRAARSMHELADYLERHPESLLRGKREESTSEGR